jgi:hypothetical protein
MRYWRILLILIIMPGCTGGSTTDINSKIQVEQLPPETQPNENTNQKEEYSPNDYPKVDEFLIELANADDPIEEAKKSELYARRTREFSIEKPLLISYHRITVEVILEDADTPFPDGYDIHDLHKEDNIMMIRIPPIQIPHLSRKPGIERIILPKTGVPETPENPLTVVPINYDIINELEFVLIPAGEFDMGSHHVTITKPFYMGKYEVTQKQWGAIMGYNPSWAEDCDECPIDSVTWSEIQIFIAELNEIEGTDKYRLPTEAEWEYAARAGTTSPYPFGDESKIDEYIWYGRNAYGKSHPVGLLKPNPWGLYDMHGNIREYVNDYYGDYPEEDVVDPKGPSSGPGNVYRGGYYTNSAGLCRSDSRYYYPDETADLGTGFRLAKSQ